MTDPLPKLTGEALSAHLSRHEDARKAATAASRGSAVALEGTLASISDEVTTEAIERRRREAAEQAATTAKRP